MVKSKLPTDAKDPVIRRMDFADSPILTFSLEADGLSDGQSYDLADQHIKPRLEQVNAGKLLLLFEVASGKIGRR